MSFLQEVQDDLSSHFFCLEKIPIINFKGLVPSPKILSLQIYAWPYLTQKGKIQTRRLYLNIPCQCASSLPLAPGCPYCLWRSWALSPSWSTGKKFFLFKNDHSHRNAGSPPRKLVSCYSQSSGSKSSWHTAGSMRADKNPQSRAGQGLKLLQS